MKYLHYIKLVLFILLYNTCIGQTITLEQINYDSYQKGLFNYKQLVGKNQIHEDSMLFSDLLLKQGLSINYIRKDYYKDPTDTFSTNMFVLSLFGKQDTLNNSFFSSNSLEEILYYGKNRKVIVFNKVEGYKKYYLFTILTTLTNEKEEYSFDYQYFFVLKVE